MRRRARSDSNESALILALKQIGCSVQRIRGLEPGVPDLLVGKDGVNYLFEVKQVKTGRLSEGQKKWHAEWKGLKPVILKSVDDVVKFLNKED